MKIKIQTKNGHKIIDINRRRAIRERCLNCSGWSSKEVLNCQFTACELYPFRTGMGKQDAKARSRATRAYCLSCMNGQSSEISKCTSPDCSLYPYRLTRLDRSIAIIDPKPKKQRIERPKRKDTYQPIA